MLPALAIGTMVVGGIMANRNGPPELDMTGMNAARDLIDKQYSNIDEYFQTANQDYETQYGSYYGTEMTDAINSLAGSGVFDSPVSENALNRKRTALQSTYAAGKSALAGEKMKALGSADAQKIQYLQNLAGVQYQESIQNYASDAQKWNVMGGIGSAMLAA